MKVFHTCIIQLDHHDTFYTSTIYPASEGGLIGFRSCFLQNLRSSHCLSDCFVWLAGKKYFPFLVQCALLSVSSVFYAVFEEQILSRYVWLCILHIGLSNYWRMPCSFQNLEAVNGGYKLVEDCPKKLISLLG